MGGFSLLEVLIALALLAYALMALIAVFSASLREVAAGDAATRAYAAAQLILEAKKHQPYADLLKDDVDGDGVEETALRDDGGDPDTAAGDGVYTAGRTENGITWVWTAEPDRPIPGVTRIVVETRWPDDGGGERALSWAILRHDPAFREETGP